MLFNSLTFVIFALLVWIVWWILGRSALNDRRYWAMVMVMLTASFVYYSWQRRLDRILVHFFLMLSYCAVGWAVGRSLSRTPRKSVLALGIVFSLSVLCFFKYTGMLIVTFANALRLAGCSHQPSPLDLLLPIGVSFYAFTVIAYMVDVYSCRARAEDSFFRFALFTSFYPHVVAGPILRAENFLTSLSRDALPTAPSSPMEALRLIARGFFKKMVLADHIALAIDPFFADVARTYASSAETAWSLPFLWLYAFQIYFDFSGYIDIARGLGLMFGFRWPLNFNLPYLAENIREFWQRWHMTLSSWLRDYLYIPLGGSRCGQLCGLANVMITMLLGGLWHGASWSFMMWGGLHGLYLCAYRAWTWTPFHRRMEQLRGAPRFIYRWTCVLFTFHLVCFSWAFFRITDFREALLCAGSIFTWTRAFAGGAGDLSLWFLLVGYGVISIVVGLSHSRLLMEVRQRIPAPLRTGFALGFWMGLFLLCWVVSPAPERRPFIYFQF